MNIDESNTADERRSLLGLPPAPDEEFAKEWNSAEVLFSSSYLPSQYSSVEHATATPDMKALALTRGCDCLSTSLMAQRDASRQAIERENAKRNGETILDVVSADDTVFGGPAHRFRQPKIQHKLSSFLLHGRVPLHSQLHTSQRPSMTQQNAFAYYASDDWNRARRECQQALDIIAAAGKKVVDTNFFPGIRDVLYPDSQNCESFAEPADVVSLVQVFPHVPLFSNGVDLCPVPQNVRSAHLCTAFHILETNQKEKSLFVAGHGFEADVFLHNFGAIGVLLFVDGQWDWVIVDDLVPVDDSCKPWFLQYLDRNILQQLEAHYGCAHSAADGHIPLTWTESDVGSLWQLLLFKATAKALGSFEALHGGIVRESIALLTGGIEVPSFELQTERDIDELIGLFTDHNALLVAWPRESGSLSGVWQASSPFPVVITEVTEQAIVVSSLFGTMRRGEERVFTASLALSEALKFLGRVEGCLIRNPQHPLLTLFDSSRPGTESRAFELELSSAIKTSVLLSLTQADPKYARQLPLSLRQRLPYCVLGVSVEDYTNGSQIKCCEVVSRDVAVVVDLEQGHYRICVTLAKGPPVPFALSVSAAFTVWMSLWRYGSDRNVHGVGTKDIPSRSEESTSSPPRHEPQVHALTRSVREECNLEPHQHSAAVVDSFNSEDLLMKGTLSLEGTERALFRYLLHHTTAGRATLAELERKKVNDRVNIDEFADLVRIFSA